MGANSLRFDARQTNEREVGDRQAAYRSVEQAYEGTQKQLDALVDLRIRGLLTDEEFLAKRNALTQERSRLKERLDDLEHRADRWLETAEAALTFAQRALSWFREGGAPERRLILATLAQSGVLMTEPRTLVGGSSVSITQSHRRELHSNLLLWDKKLMIEPVEPLSYVHNVTSKTRMLRGWDSNPQLPR